MQTRGFTFLLGIAYILIGGLALIPALYTSPHPLPHVDATTAYGNFLGVFPTNVVTDVGRIVVGFAALLAARRLGSAVRFNEALFLIMGVLTFAGFVSTINTFWGYAPLYGNAAWINGVTSVLAAYFGFVAPESAHVEPAPAAGHVA